MILFNKEELLGDERFNACLDLCPAAHPKSFQGKRGRVSQTEKVQEGREAHENENHTSKSQITSTQ